MRQGVQIVVVAHSLNEDILFMLKQASYHSISCCCLKRENRLSVFWPSLDTNM